MLRDELQVLLAPVVHRLGYELWELEYAQRAGGGLLRLYIDRAEGIGLDDCERVSHAVSEVLDVDDPIPGHYNLEVSSPGLDRVLRTHEHFARYAGHRVRLEMAEAVEGRRRFIGELVDVNPEAITVAVEGKRVTLPLKAIHKARLAPDL